MESGLIVKYTIYAHCRKIYLYEPLVNFSKTPANLSEKYLKQASF